MKKKREKYKKVIDPPTVKYSTKEFIRNNRDLLNYLIRSCSKYIIPKHVSIRNKKRKKIDES